ncbi:16S rRNA (guanine(966)-N(2))-methyltransferase RsmD [Ferruginivarius sediminum]|uniref:16S rRNA (Guanine(966)-N(2))-methyltransferase RsmD n=1 Tax=Ferruginivarius sediminum TaxID=2661937 RepID=A0A369T5A3_9PROT|nr:16S rRNA (guanine(966)-N(2))-methyltransferase RsmD [Ferruginivarius sediminum]RDD60513.1 16S rRNA (guanine(966)-N(2))-methyltransferase RsmD [Ferruginivarius sediminum]
MRIVAGRHRGRRLSAPGGEEVRPTSSLTRESLFNVLTHGRFAADGSPLADAVVLDAFAGSGANGLEALSRGAAHAIFMESQAVAISALRHNVKELGEGEHVTVIRADVTRPPRATQACDLVILDPPYGQGLAAPGLQGLAAAGWLKPGALVVVELMKTEDMPVPEGFEVLDTRRYGKAKLIFLRAPEG